MACRCNCPDFKTHVKSVNIGGFPTQTTLTERKWDLDMPAFKRLSDEGLDPPRIDGAYVMERSAKHAREIKLGRPLDAETHAVFDDAGL